MAEENFEVVIASKVDNDTVILTSEEMTKQWLEKAMVSFNNNYNQYSTVLNDYNTGKEVVTPALIDNLAIAPQIDIDTTQTINRIVRQYLNKDDLIGKAYEAIETNVNTDFSLSYEDYSESRNKKKALERAKEVIDNFNSQIKLDNLLRKAIPLSYAEGTYIMYLRSKNGSYVVDHYPLGVVEISDFELDGEPYVLLNVNELIKRIKPQNIKTKKGTPLFFKNIDDIILNNYPPEVYEAYKNREKYAKLDISRTGVVRIGNLGRKYGLTPMFRALKPALNIENYENSDSINAKAKSKKIIFQTLRKELMGEDYSRKGFEEMAFAHDSLMQAWKNKTVVYTAPAFVEDLKYVEPQVESTDINSINYQRLKIMTSLGIGFLNSDSKTTVTTASISLNELMKIINKIAEQIENIIEKWYKIALLENNIDIMYCPKLTVIDSEAMDMEIKKSLVDILHNKLNCSYETSYGLLGINVKDEVQRRISENEQGYDDIFKPHSTAYTKSSDGDDSGRPPISKDPDKQAYDKGRDSK